MAGLLWEHVLHFLVAEVDLVDGVALSFDGFEVALHVGWEEDLCGRGR